jgi:hypothetical protein
MLNHFPTLCQDDLTTAIEVLVHLPRAMKPALSSGPTEPAWTRTRNTKNSLQITKQRTLHDVALTTTRFDQMQVTTKAITEFRLEQRRTTQQLSTLQQQHEMALTRIQELASRQEQTTAESTAHIQHLDSEVTRIQATLQGVITMLQAIVPPVAPSASGADAGANTAQQLTPPYPRKGQKRDV